MPTVNHTGLPWLAVLVSFVLPAVLNAEPSSDPGLGKPATAADLAALPLTVFPDGQGLPAGIGSVSEGRTLYGQHCLSCHGLHGKEGINDALVGGHGSLNTLKPERTVGSYWPYATTLFDYIKRAMPYREPGSLSNNEVYALSAYLLHLNGIVEEEARLDALTLARIRMPNRDNFSWAVDQGETQ